MTSEHCFIQALLIMLAICAVCSKKPDRFGANPFCILCSMMLLAVKNEYMIITIIILKYSMAASRGYCSIL